MSKPKLTHLQLIAEAKNLPDCFMNISTLPFLEVNRSDILKNRKRVIGQLNIVFNNPTTGGGAEHEYEEDYRKLHKKYVKGQRNHLDRIFRRLSILYKLGECKENEGICLCRETTVCKNTPKLFYIRIFARIKDVNLIHSEFKFQHYCYTQFIKIPSKHKTCAFNEIYIDKQCTC